MQRANKKSHPFLGRVLAFLCFWLAGMTGQAGKTLWTFEPLTATTVTVLSNGTVKILYRVTNQSAKLKNLILDSRPENTPTGLSASPCQLATKGSTCTLILTINGNEMPATGIHKGPVLCAQFSASQCYRPPEANILHITRANPVPDDASISVTGSPLILFPAYPALSGLPRILTITNNSLTTTATNVSATLLADWSDVTQDASNCLSIAPGGSCQLTFTPGIVTHGPIIAPVSGSNTNSINVSLAVNFPWITNGEVYSMALDSTNNIIYLGGDFTAVGPNTGFGVAIDEASSQTLPTAPRVNSDVFTVISDGTGGWFIGGDFTQVGGVARNRIAHILSDYTVDVQFNPNANSTVRALILDGSTIYVGGDFTSIGGLVRNHIAALDMGTGQATAWNPNANSTINALALNGGIVYAGGGFTSIGGQARNYVAALDTGTGQATVWDANANSTINALAANGSAVYAGGNFTNIGGFARNRIAALDLGTGQATAWNPDANNTVNALALNASTVYAGGQFTSIGSQARNRIAALNLGTGLATGWNPDANNTVVALIFSGSTIYTGGLFTKIGGEISRGVAILPE
ncbi:hypothetical protein Lmor_0229 [Legionella moravica]|uniref:Transmembrane protein (Fibronectin III domain and Gp5 C-terminal repeat) n=1 Tax=Legionella moravica TaxID=39962 RepID=A0A378K226_9GAMM|nr:hypothetical protein [Legionella moravica]KTD38826.1 hypothetical protein Lmor_0229 [Legionella moravica]STX63752.1 transmembrane protein (fibronectin III domain and Gp5 C-terminal repeat) [Legionella moravica]